MPVPLLQASLSLLQKGDCMCQQLSMKPEPWVRRGWPRRLASFFPIGPIGHHSTADRICIIDAVG